MAPTKKRLVGRPKVSNHEDQLSFVPYTNSNNLVPPAYKDVYKIEERDRQAADRLLDRAAHCIPAGYGDPLSVLQVLDAVQRHSPAFYIRAKYMSIFLNSSQDALFWSPVTVGRIIGELAELAEDAFGKDNPLIPITQEKDYKGQYWLINSSVDAYKWFWQLRQELNKLVETMMANEKQGLYASKAESVWNTLNTEAPK